MMKQKKMILAIAIILVALLAVLGFWQPWKQSTENDPSQNTSNDTQDNTEDPSDQEGSSDNSSGNGSNVDGGGSGQEDGSSDSGIVILVDEGEIIIEIPEDQDSDGF